MLLINCSDKCVHEENGLCTLNHIIYSSNEGNDTCPFFKSKKKLNKSKYLNLENLK